MSAKDIQNKKTSKVVFFSLLLDLLAFTIILPLFPSLLEHYKENDKWGVYEYLSKQIYFFQNLVGAPEKYNSVLLGGFLGSMYSFLQFVASPIVGGLSDAFGRKTIMTFCLVGIALSYLLWAFSNNLLYFIMARFIGGISKGNVSLSMAIIADISTPETRGKGMALVGIAFSLGFIFGPMIGAIFTVWAKHQTGDWFIYPAGFALFLSVTNILYFTTSFKESLPKDKQTRDLTSSLNSAKAFLNIKDLFHFSSVSDLKSKDRRDLMQLGKVYFVYLFIYSGLEFTLTFLTHHVFNYTSMQQGWMFFAIGLSMALIQGGYVRKIPLAKTKLVAVIGLWLIIPSFFFVGIAANPYLLYLGLSLYAISTAFTVPCMMTMASQFGSPKQKGTVMGVFRSLGALARATGPIVASICFWSVGSNITYLTGAVCLLWPVLALQYSF